MAQDVSWAWSMKTQLVVFTSPPKSQVMLHYHNGKIGAGEIPLGMNTNIGDFKQGMKPTGHTVTPSIPQPTIRIRAEPSISAFNYQVNEIKLVILRIRKAENRCCSFVSATMMWSFSLCPCRVRMEKGSVTVTAEETGCFPQNRSLLSCVRKAMPRR